MKIFSKVTLIIILVITCIMATSKTSLAMKSWEEMKNEADGFIEKGSQEGEGVISDDSLSNFAMPIARALVAIASGVLLVVTIIVGIQYLMSTPSPNDKAKVKQKLIGLVVSTIVIFGAQGIWALLYNFMTEVTQ